MNPSELTPRRAFANWRKATTQLVRSILRAVPRRWSIPNPTLLFSLSVLVYLLVRVIGLTDFPIYFFTDEAVQTVIASDLVRDGFVGGDGVFLPTYFENAFLYNLSLSVYAQVIPLLLFGKSVFVTRLTSVLIGTTGAIAIGLTLKHAFQLKYWWAGALVFSAVPAWFLHSRTAFEVAIFVALMSWLLYFYLRYRKDDPRYIYAVVVFGGLSFYSYRGGQLVLIGMAVTLLLIDFRYHISHRRTLAGGLLLALVFTIPYIRFQFVHRDETYFHLRMLDTYWLYDIPLGEKLVRFFNNYFSALDPRFWFAPAGRELSRHYMKGLGHLSPFMTPFLLLGAGICLFNLDKPQFRTTLVLASLSPLGAALVGLGITRVLIFVVPAALLTTVGLSATVRYLVKDNNLSFFGWLIFSVLLLFNSYLLWDALVNGPTWFQDYGLGGMQYGARQVFGEVEELLEQDPDRTVYVSPTWANGTDILMRFFIPDDASAYMGNADGFLERERPLNNDMVFILTTEEFHRLSNSPKITNIKTLDTLDLPNGQTGFYVTTFQYSEQAERIFAEELEELSKPREATIEWNGQTVEIQYPYLDMGDLSQIFDKDEFTLARVYSANPAVFTFTFQQPVDLEGIRLTTGSMEMELYTDVYLQDNPDPLHFEQTYTDLPDDPTVMFSFGETVRGVHELRIEILSLIEGDPFKIHIRELEWITP